MSIFFRGAPEVRASGNWPTQLIPSRSTSGTMVDGNTAPHVLAYGSSVNLLASVVSMMPVDEFTGSGATKRSVPLDRLFVDPDGYGYGLQDWLYQAVSCGGYRGNAFGIIRERDGYAVPTVVQLVDPDTVAVTRESGRTVWQIDHQEYQSRDVWHYRRFPKPGNILSESPIRQYANTLGLALSSEGFGASWFADGATPSAILTSDQVVSQDDARTIKDRFMAAIRGTREPAVLGAGLSYQQIQVSPEESQFLATQQWSAAQVSRILGPGFAEVLGYATGDSMTYRNREQVALDLLTYSIDPWLTGLERSLSNLLVRPRFIKFNRAALLRADTKTRYEAHSLALAGAPFETVNQVRETEDWAPIDGADVLPTPNPTPPPVSPSAPPKA